MMSIIDRGSDGVHRSPSEPAARWAGCICTSRKATPRTPAPGLCLLRTIIHEATELFNAPTNLSESQSFLGMSHITVGKLTFDTFRVDTARTQIRVRLCHRNCATNGLFAREAIANTLLGEQIARPCWVSFQLTAKVCHKYSQVMSFLNLIRTPILF
jgi:hypothetical protein